MPQCYYITDRRNSRKPVLEQILIAIKAGVDLIQLREKDLATRDLFELAVAARALAAAHDCKIIINDRMDIAQAAGLHGIHLGQQSIPPEIIRTGLPDKDFLVAVSTHTLDEIEKVHEKGVSFITFGPVYFTPSKARFGPPVGIQKLEEACRISRIPVFALGGVNEQNVSECLQAGASGIAGISLFQGEQESVVRVVQQIHRSK
ncbi:MAG: thiamine phosphate synthase [Terriglobia bacterium]